MTASGQLAPSKSATDRLFGRRKARSESAHGPQRSQRRRQHVDLSDRESIHRFLVFLLLLLTADRRRLNVIPRHQAVSYTRRMCDLSDRDSCGPGRTLTQRCCRPIWNESVPIHMAQCRFPGLAITNAKIEINFSNEIYGSNFTKQHLESVMVRNYQNTDCTHTHTPV